MFRKFAFLALILSAPLANALDVYSASYNVDRTPIPNTTEIGLLGESQLGLSSCEQSTDPVEQDIKDGVATVSDKPFIVLNIECWKFPLTDSGGGASVRDDSRDKWLTVLAWAKEQAPNAVIGAWNVPSNPWNPYRNASALAGETQANYEAIWEVELADLTVAQDAVFPEYYIYYFDRSQWVPMTEWYTSLVRGLNPDVYVLPFTSDRMWGARYGQPPNAGAGVFICHYHEQLRAMDLYADGVVSWLTTADNAHDTTTEWYTETQSWIAGGTGRVCPPPDYALVPKRRR